MCGTIKFYIVKKQKLKTILKKLVNHLNGCLEPQGGLVGRTARSAIDLKSNHQRSQFVHVLQILVLLFFSSSVAALRSREETTLARAAMDPLSFLKAKGSMALTARPAENIME